MEIKENATNTKHTIEKDTSQHYTLDIDSLHTMKHLNACLPLGSYTIPGLVILDHIDNLLFFS